MVTYDKVIQDQNSQVYFLFSLGTVDQLTIAMYMPQFSFI